MRGKKRGNEVKKQREGGAARAARGACRPAARLLKARS